MILTRLVRMTQIVGVPPEGSCVEPTEDNGGLKGGGIYHCLSYTVWDIGVGGLTWSFPLQIKIFAPSETPTWPLVCPSQRRDFPEYRISSPVCLGVIRYTTLSFPVLRYSCGPPRDWTESLPDGPTGGTPSRTRLLTSYPIMLLIIKTRV